MRTLIMFVSLTLILTMIASDRLMGQEPKAPSTVGGFTLKRSIDEYQVKDQGNYLNEVIVPGIAGFRKSFITYGTCENPGKILRIKLKYHDRSTDFFNELLKRYKEKFGSKPKFSGDQFGNVKSWRWSLTNEAGERVSIVLQHNLKDEEESIGNMVKLSLPELMDAERICFNNKYLREDQYKERNPDWEVLIPR